MHVWGNYGWGPGMGFGLGGIFMILFWGLAILGIVYIVKQATTKKSATICRQETPLDILKIRYAKGEITKEEFEKLKNDIMRS